METRNKLSLKFLRNPKVILIDYNIRNAKKQF